MFSNGRKTIGLFIFNPQLDFQSEVCRGMANRAEQLGYNLAIFASYGKYGNIHDGYEAGEKMIYNLPCYDKLAGVVIATDTITIQGVLPMILEQSKKNASCPVVSLREPLEGVHNIIIDESTSMEGMVRHLIEKHGKKDIAFMTGQRDRADGQARLDCFKRVMSEYGYPVGEHRVFYGDFWRGKGKEACDWFIHDGTCPEAIMCANDYMAMAVIDELFERGIHVPEDVIVTGYDGVSEGSLYSPSLSTVRIDFEDMAHKAVDLIDRHQNDGESGEQELEVIHAVAKVVEMASCGCKSKDDSEIIALKCQIHKNEAIQRNRDMQFSFFTIDLSNTRQFDDLHEVVTRYIYNIEDFEDYFICLRNDIASKAESFHGFTDQMEVRVAIRNRVNTGNVQIPFNRRQLLPDEFVDDSPQCYYFFPIHYMDTIYGYEAYSFQGDGRWGETYVRWSISVSNAIYNVRFCNKLNELVFELENMYIQDVLTGLYNRRGFEKYGRMQFLQARAEDKRVCVIGIDMDGLKPINDIYGHHEGDSALRAVGYAIQEARLSGQIGARIGGDEYEVIFSYEHENEIDSWLKQFEHSLEKFNEKSLKPYKVHASYGYKAGVPTASDTIESYMKAADDQMYKNKLENKRKRNEAFR